MEGLANAELSGIGQDTKLDLSSTLAGGDSLLHEGCGQLEVRDYQKVIFEQIVDQWRSDARRYGSIIFMPTGSGKTFLAIMLIEYIFGLRKRGSDALLKRSSADMARKAEPRESGQVYTEKVAFLVPTNNLVDQQHEVINQFTPLRVHRFSGSNSKTSKMGSGEEHLAYWRS